MSFSLNKEAVVIVLLFFHNIPSELYPYSMEIEQYSQEQLDYGLNIDMILSSTDTRNI